MKISVEELLGVNRSYVINLDRRTDRLKSFIKNVEEKKLVFSNLERFSAIDAKTMNDSYINSIIDISAQKGVFGKRDYHEELNGKGSVGCYLSHFTLWKKCIELNEPILIMEDDIDFANNFMEKLEIVHTYLPQKGLTLFNYQFNTKPEKINKYIFKVKHFFFLQFYTITPEFIKEVYPFLFPIKYQIDSVLSFLSPFVNIYAVSYDNKPLVVQIKSKSDVQTVADVAKFQYLDKTTNNNKYKYGIIGIVLILTVYLFYRYRKSKN